MTNANSKNAIPGPQNAMILAAGLGIRMRPLTDNKPKAMVEIGGKPLIGHTLDFLKELNLKRIVVNIHYQPGPLVNYLENHELGDKIVISDETRKILDTGGAVKKVLPRLGSGPFFVANCDAFFYPGKENPFLTLARNYTSPGGLLLLEEVKRAKGYKGRGDFIIKTNRILERRGKNQSAPFVFTGLQILTPDLFSGIREKVFSLNRVYDQAIEENRLKGVRTKNPWFHIGSPEALLKAEKVLGANDQ